MDDRVTIVGAGNGGVAAAAELTLLGHEVCLFNRTQSRLDPFEQMGGVHLINESEDRGIVPISHMTTNIGEALNGSRIVIVMVPTSGLGYYAAEMSPHLRKDHSVLLAPGHTGGVLLFCRVVESSKGEIPGLVGETNTLPYVCRMTDTGEVTVWRHSQALLTAALPATETEDFCDLVSSLLPENGVIGASSVLETSLSNYNAVMHPAGMILNAGWIENPDEQFRYYSQGHGPAIGRVIAAVDSERVEIGTSLDIELLPFLDSFYRSGYTTEAAWKSGSVDLAITESGPNREIVAPSSLQDRYVEEDIGFGLVPMMKIAAVAGVETPAIGSLVALAEIATGDDYGSKGLTAASMGIDGMTKEQLLTYVNTGK